MNYFNHLFPSLLKRNEPFLVSMKTPIVRVKRKEGDLLFYDENKYRQYAIEHPNHKCRYYKGLGGAKSEDIHETFGEKMVEYVNDDGTQKSINKVFHKDRADDRKKWLEQYDPNRGISLDDQGKLISMNISSFLENEVIKFSIDDCHRSIPNIYDGLKQSQRKILYAVKKKKVHYSGEPIKVAQLAGYTSEHTNYKHGEDNLNQTIVKMAQCHVGSNNIPLMYRDGQFGSRSKGDDFASPRYIFTKKDQLTDLIFREEDDVLLEYLVDDGDVVEPRFYIPIIPMALVNGGIGIGSGWSSSIPSYNPLDLVNAVKYWMDNDGNLELLSELIPWYRGFEGQIIKDEKNKRFVTYGVITKEKNKVHVSEIPVNMFIDKFKENCEDWLTEKKIKKLENYSTPNKPSFIITEDEDGFSCNVNNLKLYTYLSTSNMVLFNEKDQLKKYTINQIIGDFCLMRFDFYKKRKHYMISNFEKELCILENKARFVTEIVERKLNVMNIPEEVIVKELENRKYDKIRKNDKSNEDEDEDETKGGHGYDYLLKLQVRTLTESKVKQLQNDFKNAKQKLDKVKSTSPKQMWINDLEEFETQYIKWVKSMEKNETGKPPIKKKTSTKK